MAYVWKSHIVCDSCGAKHQGLPNDSTLKLLRRSAAGAGWTFSKLRDVCEACQPPAPIVKENTTGLFDLDAYFRLEMHPGAMHSSRYSPNVNFGSIRGRGHNLHKRLAR